MKHFLRFFILLFACSLISAMEEEETLMDTLAKQYACYSMATDAPLAADIENAKDLLLDVRRSFNRSVAPAITDEIFKKFVEAAMGAQKTVRTYRKEFEKQLITAGTHTSKLREVRVAPTPSSGGTAGRGDRSPSPESGTTETQPTHTTANEQAAPKEDIVAKAQEGAAQFQKRLNDGPRARSRSGNHTLYSHLIMEMAGIDEVVADQALEYAQKNLPEERHLSFMRAVKAQALQIGKNRFEREKERFEATLRKDGLAAAQALYEPDKLDPFPKSVDIPVVTSSDGDGEPGILDRMGTKFQKHPRRWAIGIGLGATALLAIVGGALGTFLYLKSKKTAETDLNNPAST